MWWLLLAPPGSSWLLLPHHWCILVSLHILWRLPGSSW